MATGKAQKRSVFQLTYERGAAVTTITIRMGNSEAARLISALSDDKGMRGICELVDPSPLGKALSGSTFCARCYDAYGQIRVSHQFGAKNWVSAFTKAVYYCGTKFELGRGKCGSGPGQVIVH